MASTGELYKNPLVVSAGIVLVAAVIFSGTLIWISTSNTNPNLALDPSNFVPEDLVLAEDGQPAYLTLPEGAENPADKLVHYPFYEPIPGLVSAISANSLTIVSAETEEEMTFSVDSDTDIYKMGKEKDEQAFEKETEEFLDALSYATSNDIYIAPDLFERVPIQISDLEIDTPVDVNTVSKNSTKANFILDVTPYNDGI
jgi:hypothetical protein